MHSRIELKDLRLIRRIAEHGSLTRAAALLHVTQSAVSQRLASLQHRLDLTLFEKCDGRLRATPEGLRLLDAASNVDRELTLAFEDLRHLKHGNEDRLRITTQCYTCYRWLPFVIRPMHARFPNTQIDVVPDATDDPYEALVRDRIDVAIVSDLSIPRGFREAALFDDELFAVMSQSHALARRRFLTPSNFEEQTVIVYSGRQHAILEEVLHPAGVSPGKLVEIRITEAIVELARFGHGIAVLSGWAFHDLEDRHGLAAVRITRGGFRRCWRAVSRKTARQEPLRTFIDEVRYVGNELDSHSWRAQMRTGMAGSRP